jgi:hypothetical protein
MRQCEMVVGIVAVTVWCVVYAVVSLVIFLVLAIPFGLLFVIDTFAGERVPATVTVAPPTPPRHSAAMKCRMRRVA